MKADDSRQVDAGETHAAQHVEGAAHVGHELLMRKPSVKIGDERVLRLIRRYLEAGMMAGGGVSPRSEGALQGGLLSPLLSNILLTDLDQALARRHHAFCRYADDGNIHVRSLAAGRRGSGPWSA